MQRIFWGLLAAVALAPTAQSFCGFYVAQEAGSLFNTSSKVVLARDGNRTALTMSSDYRGAPEEFGLVVPVPTVIKKGMVSVVDASLIENVDQYTVPRLAQYYDPSPCPLPGGSNLLTREFLQRIPASRSYQTAVQTLPGVTVEERFDVEEYDITVIAGDTGADVARWLETNGYTIPKGADAILESYVKQGMHFFLAKIDAAAQEGQGLQVTRPLQLRYESPKFMLPIRLGTVNADGAQDLVVLALTKNGRIESTNYRTKRMPTDIVLPEAVVERSRFVPFYEAAFAHQVEQDEMSAVYIEYAWPLAQSCDPCTGAISIAGVTALGADWSTAYHGGFDAGFITRLHVRYDMAHFPEDLVFQETLDKEPWQARYVVHRAAQTTTWCEALEPYLAEVAEREQRAMGTLSELTGWSEREIEEFLQ